MANGIFHPIVLAKSISANFLKFSNSFPTLFGTAPIQKFRVWNIVLCNFNYFKFVVKEMPIPIWVKFTSGYHAINHEIFIGFHLIISFQFSS